MSDFSGNPIVRKVLSRMQAYCARQERCCYDISLKLKPLLITDDEKSKIIEALKEESFIDENRYVSAFVKDKIKLNHWGKIKITHVLRQKQLNDSTIEKGLESIDQDEYLAILDLETKKIIQQKRIVNTYEDKAKLARSLQGKGFEPELIFNSINRMMITQK